MAKKLNSQITEIVKQVPRRLVRRMFQKKLEAQDVSDEALLEAMTDHLLGSRDEPFKWESDTDIVIAITDQDLKDLLADMKDAVDVTLPKALTEAIKVTSSNVVKRLEKRWPEIKLSERHEMQYFKDRLDLRWSPVLDPLHMMLVSSREVGETFAQKLSRSKAKKGIIKRKVLVMLHMRACQTTMEILTLLESGLPDGAYARWRTLYEISVVCFLVSRFGDEIAERYLAHEIVSERESVINELRHEGRTYEPEKMEEEFPELEAEYQAAIAKYGAAFKSSYGWAAHSLNLKAPRFADLEEAVDWTSLPSDYKWSSYKVHAGVAGTVWTLGTLGNRDIILAGATNAGLEVPAINAAYSLLHVTSVLFEAASDVEIQVQMNALILLRDKVLANSRKVVKKLKRDHIEFLGGL
ncbi:DUF5677 domain-containing protein [Neorhizobium sp. CSC1952]|uniref:DUF5677 domain-containing protein n=1 Tax=Neorhizobium sp. CSC1952 TaxID=2978974 RepID=UPI0025A5C16F|nr:DUF5677 domain-containing protein [Rhizobium sp. CSC1952]WJR67080.1 DUF5677 domain-containing protein [Rhizobium sp. CSC1952]